VPTCSGRDRSLRLDDLPVGVLAPDAPRVVEVEQVAASYSHALALGRGPREQPPRDTELATDPVLVVSVVNVGQAAEALCESLAHRRGTVEASAPRVLSARRLQHAVLREER